MGKIMNKLYVTNCIIQNLKDGSVIVWFMIPIRFESREQADQFVTETKKVDEIPAQFLKAFEDD